MACWLYLLPVGGKIWLCLHHKCTSIMNKLLFCFNSSGVYCIKLLYLSIVPLLILFFNMWKKSNQCENNAESIWKPKNTNQLISMTSIWVVVGQLTIWSQYFINSWLPTECRLQYYMSLCFEYSLISKGYHWWVESLHDSTQNSILH